MSIKLKGMRPSLNFSVVDNREDVVHICTVTLCGGGNRYMLQQIIIESPTGNCQVGSIAYMNRLLYMLEQTRAKGAKKKAYAQEFISKILEEVDNNAKFGSFYKNLFIVDINRELKQRLESYFDVISSVPYTSTNNSEMILCIIKI